MAQVRNSFFEEGLNFESIPVTTDEEIQADLKYLNLRPNINEIIEFVLEVGVP